MPALLTRMSTEPCRSATPPTNRSTSAAARDVGLNERGRDAGRRQFADRLITRGAAQIAEGDLRALRCEPLHNRATNPRAPPVTIALLPSSRCIALSVRQPADLARGAGDQALHRRSRPERLAVRNRAKNRAVLRQRAPGAPGQPARRAEADEQRRIDHARHLLEQLVAGRANDREVKPHVGFVERVVVAAVGG